MRHLELTAQIARLVAFLRLILPLVVALLFNSRAAGGQRGGRLLGDHVDPLLP